MQIQTILADIRPHPDDDRLSAFETVGDELHLRQQYAGCCPRGLDHRIIRFD